MVKNEGQQLLSTSSEPWKGSQLFPFSTLFCVTQWESRHQPASGAAGTSSPVWAPLACWCKGGRLAALSPPPFTLGTCVYTYEQKIEMQCYRDKSAQMEIMASYYLKKPTTD